MNAARRWLLTVLAPMTVGLAPVVSASTLSLEQTISLPNVEGRIDHFAHDAVHHRLFVAALGNNSVEVIDLAQAKVVHHIEGLTEPQGIYFLGESNRLYVANGGDGTVRVFDGSSYAPLATIKTDEDADNLRYDASGKRLYVGHGGGALGIIDVATNALVADIAVQAHPESLQLEQAGPLVFVNVPNAHNITVVDRAKKSVVATWALGDAGANFPMAFDETNRRLIVACRRPAQLLVFDTTSGHEIAKVDLHGDCDDLFLDPIRKQLYASCGEGFIDVFAQADPDHYALKEAIPTETKARTSFFDGSRLYLAVPKRGSHFAEVRCYRIEGLGAR
jgi:DNA-binding beta-propeller fold protein YncE